MNECREGNPETAIHKRIEKTNVHVERGREGEEGGDPRAEDVPVQRGMELGEMYIVRISN